MINTQELDTEVALIKKDINNIGQLCDKLDANVVKISEVANDVSKLLALHEQRIDNLSQNDKILDAKLEKNHGDFQEEMKELHSHIRNNNRDLLDKMKSTEESIKSDIRFVKELIDRENKSLRDSMQEENQILRNSIALNHTRITALERWRYIVVGVSLVIIWVADKIPLTALFTH